MEAKAGSAVKPSELELARQLEYIRMIREKNDAFEMANGRKKKFYSLAEKRSFIHWQWAAR